MAGITAHVLMHFGLSTRRQYLIILQFLIILFQSDSVHELCLPAAECNVVSLELKHLFRQILKFQTKQNIKK